MNAKDVYIFSFVLAKYVLQTCSGDLNVLTLLPLTGFQEVKGLAQLEAIRIATEDVLTIRGLSSNTDTGFSFMFNDTQCSLVKESEIVLQELTRQSEQLVVLGGGCLQQGTHQDIFTLTGPGATQRLKVPQLMFEAGLPWTGKERRENYLSVKPTYSSVHQVLSKFLLKHSWKQVIILHEETTQHKLGAAALEQLVNVDSNVSLHLPASHLQINTFIKASFLRVVIVHGSLETLFSLVCDSVEAGMSNRRLIWLLVEIGVESSSPKAQCDIPWQNIRVFNTAKPEFSGKKLETFTKELESRVGDLPQSSVMDAAYAYDATTVLLTGVLGLSAAEQELTEPQFSRALMAKLRSSSVEALSGTISFESDGRREVVVSVLRYEETDGKWKTVNAEETDLNGDAIQPVEEIDGVPLWLWGIVSSLAVLAIIYAVAIAVFNIVKRGDRMIKMTSPNLNVVISLGAVPGLAVVVLSGLDSSRVSSDVMSTVLQTCAWLLTISFTLMYGCMFSKTWRVFLIFKNLNSNGKNMRDEHLLVAAVVLLVLDVAILLPWTLADGIHCHQVVSFQYLDEDDLIEKIYKSDICTSDLQVLWITLLFILKGCVVLLGGYFTYQTRHVTLPTLKDTHEVYSIIFTTVSMAMVCLPLLLVSRVGHVIKYATASLVILIVIISTLTLAFATKMYVAWKESDKQSPESLKLQFSESLRRTQENIAECTLCCFSSSSSEKPEDIYAHEMLATEIETLKRTIKEKDATIRELTDRLYFGAEKFQEYLTTPRTPHRHYNSVMMHPVSRKKHQLAHRSYSQPVFNDLPKLQTDNSLPHMNTQRTVPQQHRHVARTDRLSVPHHNSPKTGHSTSSIRLSVENLPDDGYHDAKHYISEYAEIPEYDNSMYTNKAYRSSSPNNDSAIENTSPSSISSGSYIEQPPYRPNTEVILENDDRYGADVPECRDRMARRQQHRYEDRDPSYASPAAMQSYYGVHGVAVSQI